MKTPERLSACFITVCISFYLFYSYRPDPTSSLAGNTIYVDKVKGLSKKAKIELAYEQEFLMTKDPKLNRVPRERLYEAEKIAFEIQNNSMQAPQALLTWTERGPNNVGGRTRAILFDQNDPTGNTVYAGSVSGGLWKTVNFKSVTPTWSLVPEIALNLAISSIAQNPIDFDEIYVGTGEGFFNIDAVKGRGIFKSSDGGTSWAQLSSTIPLFPNVDFEFIQKIVVAANGHVYASGRSTFCNAGGLLKSKDAGATWSRVIGTYTGCGNCVCVFDFNANDIEIAANGDVYATVGLKLSMGKIFKSSIATHGAGNVGDVGNWIEVTPTPGTFQRIEIAVAPSNDQRVYALFQGVNDDVSQIRRSDDAAASWNTLTVPTTTSNDETQIFSGNQAFYNLCAIVDPGDEDHLIIGGLDLLRTRDAGANWEQISVWSLFMPPVPLGVNQYMHADHHALVFEPGTTSNMAFGNDGGVFYSTNMNTPIGTPPTYISKSAGYHTTQFYSGELHPTSLDYFLGGTQDNGVQKFTGPGLGPTVEVLTGDGGFCYIDQTDGQIQIASYVFNEYSISTNGGTSFPASVKYSAEGRFINPTDYDDESNILYTCDVAEEYGILKDLTTTAVYSTVNIPIPGTTDFMVSAIKVDPNLSSTVFLALQGTGIPKIFRVENAASATPVFTDISNSLASSNSYISSIDVEPGNSDHILVTHSNYGIVSVWETVNGGSIWTNVEGNLPDMPIRWASFVPEGFSPGNNPTAIGGVVLATELGIWSTTTLNGGSTNWIPNNTEMGNVRTDMVRIRNSDKLVLAATHGRGFFTATLLNALPVTLVHFSGHILNGRVQLKWQSSFEKNNMGFEIQKSYDGQNFKKIDFVNGKGNGVATTLYHFNDPASLAPVQFYRLKQIDRDGRATFSAIVTIKKTSNGKLALLSVNNPFDKELKLSFSKSVTGRIDIQLIGMSGQIFVKKSIGGSNSSQLNIWVGEANLPKGTYILRIRSGEMDITRRLIRQ